MSKTEMKAKQSKKEKKIIEISSDIEDEKEDVAVVIVKKSKSVKKPIVAEDIKVKTDLKEEKKIKDIEKSEEVKTKVKKSKPIEKPLEIIEEKKKEETEISSIKNVKKSKPIKKDKILECTDVISENFNEDTKSLVEKVDKVIKSKIIRSDKKDDSKKKTIKQKNVIDGGKEVEAVKEVKDLTYLKIPTNKTILELEINSNDSKIDKELSKAIENAHNVLFNSDENISGVEALNDIMNLLFIKMLKPFLSDTKQEGKIDLLNKEHYFKDGRCILPEAMLDEVFTYFQDLGKLANQGLDSIRNIDANTDLIRRMGKVLKTHPLTKQIFPEENFIKMKSGQLVQQFLHKCIIDTVKNKENTTKNKSKTDKQNNTESDKKKRTDLKTHIIDTKVLETIPDAIGSIYEYFISKYLKGSSQQGQFFTPRTQMKIALKYIYDIIIKLFEDLIKKNDKLKIGDFCMGTAGWLIIFFNMFKENYGNNIDVYGNDVKENTYQLGLMNLIITMGKLPNTENINCSSSLTHVNDTKLHFIATNPPFKTDMPFGNIKDLFESYQEKTGGKIKIEDVYKLQSNSPPIQFIELCIYKLVENGLCVIVLPFGELFTGGGDNERFRRHMLDNTNITDIIGFPSGIYKHTGITTAIVIFRNDKSGTKSIKFSRVEANSNKECEKIIELFDISKEDLLKHSSVSFNSNDYIKEDEVAYSDAIEVKTLGEVCELIIGNKTKSKYGKEKGLYPLYYCSILGHLYLDDYNYVGEGIIINKTNGSGKVMVYYGNNKYNVGETTIHFKSKNNAIQTKYIYYYLLNNINILQKYFKGANQKSITEEDLFIIKIPIPSLEKQQEIITYCENNDRKIKELEKEIIDNKAMAKKFLNSVLTQKINLEDVEPLAVENSTEQEPFENEEEPINID